MQTPGHRRMQGVEVTISGAQVPQGQPFTVSSRTLGKTRPGGTPDPGLKSPVFYDVAVRGLSGGTATISITDDSVGQGTRMRYWGAGKWSDAGGVSVRGKTVTGTVPVGSLGGTPIVIGI